jgi:hypothetical protein
VVFSADDPEAYKGFGDSPMKGGCRVDIPDTGRLKTHQEGYIDQRIIDL